MNVLFVYEASQKARKPSGAKGKETKVPTIKIQEPIAELAKMEAGKIPAYNATHIICLRLSMADSTLKCNFC